MIWTHGVLTVFASFPDLQETISWLQSCSGLAWASPHLLRRSSSCDQGLQPMTWPMSTIAREGWYTLWHTSEHWKTVYCIQVSYPVTVISSPVLFAPIGRFLHVLGLHVSGHWGASQAFFCKTHRMTSACLANLARSIRIRPLRETSWKQRGSHPIIHSGFQKSSAGSEHSHLHMFFCAYCRSRHAFQAIQFTHG